MAASRWWTRGLARATTPVRLPPLRKELHERTSTCRPSRGNPDGNQGNRAAARSIAQQGHRFQRSRARRARSPRPPSAARLHAGRAGRPHSREFPQQAHRSRQVRQPDGAARPQRGAVLPDPDGLPGRDDPDRLHADRRSRVPAIRTHLSASARHLHQRQRPRPHRGGPGQLAAPRRGDHRRHRRRENSGPRGSGRGRDGNPRRQALALHRVRGNPAQCLPAGAPRRRHQQCGAPRGPVLPGPAPAAPARRRIRRAGR